jgi:hypothetical protein
MTKKRTKPVNEKPKYSPTPEERATIGKRFNTPKGAPVPQLKVEDGKVSIDHPDELTGFLLMQDALGTANGAFMFGLLGQLARTTSGEEKVSETDLNFMVSVIKGIKPRDQVESMLAAQMAAIHMAMLKFVGHLPRIKTLPQQDAAERAINKFARTFAAQMEALKRYRTGGEQKVTVQHVSVSEGGQAIVGNVTQGRREATPEGAATPPLVLTKTEAIPMPIIESKMQTPVEIAPTSKKK